MNTTEPELSVAQAARELNVTPDRVRQLLKSGQLVFRTTPLGRLIDAASVESLRVHRVASGRVAATAGVR